jgi:hypothetical protein
LGAVGERQDDGLPGSDSEPLGDSVRNPDAVPGPSAQPLDVHLSVGPGEEPDLGWLEFAPRRFNINGCSEQGQDPVVEVRHASQPFPKDPVLLPVSDRLGVRSGALSALEGAGLADRCAGAVGGRLLELVGEGRPCRRRREERRRGAREREQEGADENGEEQSRKTQEQERRFRPEWIHVLILAILTVL